MCGSTNTHHSTKFASLAAEVERLSGEVERLRAVLVDAAYLARLARGSSWPGDMAERVERMAERVIATATLTDTGEVPRG